MTRIQIVQGLRAIGLWAGDLGQVPSVLSALGNVSGGAVAVVDALPEVVGPDGTIMMPTFSHDNCDVFDPWHSPLFNGAITEVLCFRPQSRRSRHSTHAYTAVGRLADMQKRLAVLVDTQGNRMLSEAGSMLGCC